MRPSDNGHMDNYSDAALKSLSEISAAIEPAIKQINKLMIEWWKSVKSVIDQINFGNRRRVGGRGMRYECDGRLWAARHGRKRYNRIVRS